MSQPPDTFEIVLDGDNRVIPVRADQSVLQALMDAGCDVPSSCEQGVCGTCMTQVKAGTPDHRDAYLTPDERAANDVFMPCCSRSLSAQLVIAL